MRKSIRSYVRHEKLHFLSRFRLAVDWVSQPSISLLNGLSEALVTVKFALHASDLSGAQGRSARVMLFPYPFAPTIFLHSILRRFLTRQGVEAELCSSLQSTEMGRVLSPQLPIGGQSFETLTDAVNYLVKLCEGDQILATSIVDQFVRYEPVSYLTEKVKISEAFLRQFYHTVGIAKYFAQRSDVLVTGDSSYLSNGALISAFLSRGKKVFVLDYVGKFREVTLEKSERRNRDFFYTSLGKMRRTESEIVGEKEAKSFLNRRFSGVSSDDEVARAFSGSNLTSPTVTEPPKKVLFLHVLRDANGQVGSEQLGSPLFRTYIEWTDAALRLVSENPDDWIVKPHPGREKYAGDQEILSYLLQKHRLPARILDEKVSARSVLENRLPIYSHDGTIIREAACFAYKAYSVSVHLPDEITARAKSLSEFEHQFRLPRGHRVPEIRDDTILRAARMMLHDHVNEELTFLRRHPAQVNTGSYIGRKFLPYRIMFRLARMTWSSGGQSDLQFIAKHLLEEQVIDD